jgi:hypothetical protein
MWLCLRPGAAALGLHCRSMGRQGPIGAPETPLEAAHLNELGGGAGAHRAQAHGGSPAGDSGVDESESGEQAGEPNEGDEARVHDGYSFVEVNDINRCRKTTGGNHSLRSLASALVAATRSRRFRIGSRIDAFLDPAGGSSWLPRPPRSSRPLPRTLLQLLPYEAHSVQVRPRGPPTSRWSVGGVGLPKRTGRGSHQPACKVSSVRGLPARYRADGTCRWISSQLPTSSDLSDRNSHRVGRKTPHVVRIAGSNHSTAGEVGNCDDKSVNGHL